MNLYVEVFPAEKTIQLPLTVSRKKYCWDAFAKRRIKRQQKAVPKKILWRRPLYILLFFKSLLKQLIQLVTQLLRGILNLFFR